MPGKNGKSRKDAAGPEHGPAPGSGTPRARNGKGNGARPDLGNSASRIVYEAASILEDEIASGIVAAKQVETGLLRRTARADGSRSVLIQRFRKDLHEVVDMLLDLLDAAAQYADVPLQASGGAPGVSLQPKVARSQNGHLAMLAVPGTVKAGSTAAVTMRVNNGAERAVRLRFASTDLASAAGEQIAARQVTCAPAALALKPGEGQEVEVTISVPRGKPPGTYIGWVQASGQDQPQGLLVVHVG